MKMSTKPSFFCNTRPVSLPAVLLLMQRKCAILYSVPVTFVPKVTGTEGPKVTGTFKAKVTGTFKVKVTGTKERWRNEIYKNAGTGKRLLICIW